MTSKRALYRAFCFWYKKGMRRYIIFLSVLLAILPGFVVADDLSAICQQISQSDNSCQNLSAADCRATLEKCAVYYDQQSAQIAQDITKTAQQKNTLQSKIGSLKKKITGLEYQIVQGTLMVKDLTGQISDIQVSIDKTSLNIENSQRQIATILRAVAQEDKKPSVQILIEGNLSDYFGNVAYLETLNSKVSTLLDSTKNLKSYLDAQKAKQEQEKGQLQQTIKIQSLQKAEQLQTKQQQEGYLKLTEAQYQQQVQDKADADKKAAAIKSRIFDLLGVANAPNFGQAVEIAKYVSGITGVRAAFVLAILTQESNLGKNVGQCYLTNKPNLGDGVKIKTGAYSPRTMNVKSIPVFLNIINQINAGKGLARDPYSTPVSCVIWYGNEPVGTGGAMGPSQFEPRTWAAGYGQRVTNITGKIADPWDIRDAFLATGLLLRDNGGVTNEFNAAMKYYCGGGCTRYDRFYGNSVIRIANQYEADIKAIGG